MKPAHAAPPKEKVWVDDLVFRADVRTAILRAVSVLLPIEAVEVLEAVTDDIRKMGEAMESVSPLLRLPPAPRSEPSLPPPSTPALPAEVRVPPAPLSRPGERTDQVLSVLKKPGKTPQIIERLGIADDSLEVHRLHVRLSQMKSKGLIQRSKDGEWSRV